MFGFNTINNKINSALINNVRKPAFLNLSDIEKVLILFTYKDWTEISEISKDLESIGKEVILWTVYLPRNEKIEMSFPPNVKVVTQKEISKWKGLSMSVVDEFKKLKYDTLLDLTTKDDKPLHYLLACNSAKFCIGIREQELKFFDFTLLKEEDVNLEETYKQLKNYLNNMC